MTTAIEPKITRPLVRYHGGKYLLAPWIISQLPAHRVYTECYGGGGSVLLRKPRSYGEIYNDLDGEIVNLFRVARDHGPRLRTMLELTPFSRVEYRLSFDVAECPIEQARRTLCRSYMGFGSDSLNRSIKSGFRANSNRSGTMPAHDWTNYPGAFSAIIERLKGVVIENRPAIEVMQAHDSAETVHYVDPPYVHDTRMTNNAHGAHGYAHEMTDDDHRLLSYALAEMEGMVVLSGYPSPLYDELYHDWRRVERAALADGARPRTEVLWLSPNIPESRGLFSGSEAI